MCSIIGYAGDETAAPILVDSLRKMEYRGYDSVGVATRADGVVSVRKGTGRVDEVNGKVGMDKMGGMVGVGHTRWATHGEVSDANAHPHLSSGGEVAIVHNGVIENHQELRRSLERAGYSFSSQTDSEVIANLIQMHHDRTGDIGKSMIQTVSEIKGHYAFIAMFRDGTISAARYGEPLIAGISKGGLFLSSDVRGFIGHTDEAVYLESGTCVLIRDGRMSVTDYRGNASRYRTTTVSREFGDVTKGEHAHYTLKEIEEQPGVVRRAGDSSRETIRKVAGLIREGGFAYATGNGSSYNAALLARQALARFAGIRLDVVISSEMSSERGMLRPGTVMLAISQSGESADVLDAAGMAKEAGCIVVGIVNAVNSSLARAADMVIRMDCGPEVGVAATKSLCSQYGIMLRLAGELAGETVADAGAVAEAISAVINHAGSIRKAAAKIRDITDLYVLGRGVHYPVAMEAALKIKELTYIHAEGLSGGEMKHGPLALIEEGSYVMVMNPYDSTYGDMLLGAQEAKARGARIIGVSDRRSSTYDHWIRIPKGGEVSYPFAEIVASQLLAYHTALARETDPDYPRNLAKSVTVK